MNRKTFIIIIFQFILVLVGGVQDNSQRLLDSHQRLVVEKPGVANTTNEDFKYDSETPVYDFIIVGGGSTGSVIANRLSEIHNWKILLLEAGPEPTILTDVPPWSPLFQFTNYNWGYLTEKQTNMSLGMIDEKMHWPRGKVLGGSSVINYMVHVRGNKEDYDKWEALGNPGWSYKNLLPLFRKIEDSNLRIADPGYHNTGGPLSVEDVPYKTKSVQVLIAAAQESGYKYVDYNGKNQLGVSFVQATTKRGSRCSAEKAFLRKVQTRPNLTILTKSRATKLLIGPKSKRAYGIEFVRHKRYHKAKSNNEVILSTGVFNSPQLLMLSGVGPTKHLREFNIPVLHDLPVGQKLYDHLTYPGLLFTVNQSIVIQQSQFEEPMNILSYLLHGAGPITVLGGYEALVFLKTNVTSFKGNYPDIQLVFIGGGLHTDGGKYYRKMMRMKDEIYNEVFKPLENLYAFSIWPTLLHPKSYGCLKLKSKNPFHWPKLYGNYLTDPENNDIKKLVTAIREAQRIASAPAFQQYGVQQVRTLIPGCKNYKYDSDEYWECAMRHISVTMYHQTSTCKMGPPNDPEAVVDSTLRVYGIRNLRVADTSIFPTTVSGNTNAPAYIVGEMASEFIKKEWLSEV